MQDDQTTSQPIQEAEIIQEDNQNQSPPLGQTSISPAAMVLEIESLIKQHITGLNTRRTQLKQFKEMVADVFKNDSEYQESEHALKEATKEKKNIKFRLMRQPGVEESVEKVKELSSEIKELDGALSDYLREYQRLSGSNEIEDDEGNVHEIVYQAKLLKKFTKK